MYPFNIKKQTDKASVNHLQILSLSFFKSIAIETVTPNSKMTIGIKGTAVFKKQFIVIRMFYKDIMPRKFVI